MITNAFLALALISIVLGVVQFFSYFSSIKPKKTVYPTRSLDNVEGPEALRTT